MPIHARKHTCARAHTHTHTHTHARSRRYAKLVTELNQSSPPPIAELMRNIQALIGNFSLDPNRVLDHIMTALSACDVKEDKRSRQVGRDCVSYKHSAFRRACCALHKAWRSQHYMKSRT